MSDPAGRTGKNLKRDGGKPSLTCAVCNRQYRAIQTPGIPSHFSICPDCRLTDADPAPGEKI
jgi:hypothetical protein